MSRKDLVVVVSRGGALYLFVWAFETISYLPGELRSLLHHLSQQSALAVDYYWRNGDIWSIVFTLARTTLLLAVAIWLYRCGPRVEKFFSLPKESTE